MNTNRIIDCQVHCYERNHPQRPWAGDLHGPREMTGAEMVATMDRLGIDGALLVSPWAMYRFDGSYALDVGRAYPHRFGLIKPFDPRREDVAEEITAWAQHTETVGARIMMGPPASRQVDTRGVDRILNSCREQQLPVNVLAWGNIEAFASTARRHPDVHLILDHLGLLQPFEPPVPEAPFAELEQVLRLADLSNVAIKISGACTLSRESYPFNDIWPYLEEIINRFGIERCMWGTDWTRAIELISPDDAVNAFRQTTRFNERDKAALMGGSLSDIYNWRPTHL